MTGTIFEHVFAMVKSGAGVSKRQSAEPRGTIADTALTGDRTALDSTPRERISNRGGGYVTHVEVVRRGDGHVLRFRAPAGAVRQIRLVDGRYTPIESWSYRMLRGSGAEPTQAVRQLLTLLGNVLTLPCGDELDYALARDWYKSPVDGVAPGAWPNTSTGDLVSRGKYWYKDQADAVRQRECGLALVDLLAEVVDRHPLLCDVAAIAAVPGHDAKILSFGARLASAVARVLGKPLVPCSSLTDFRPPAKGMDPGARAPMIENQFRCQERVSGQSLLIVDDVYSSGSTANEAARALRVAGATWVASLCAVRTMKS